jgi:glycosyltransferase involved in cell wall biosynthesis
VKATRLWARVRLPRDRRGGVTVLVVNWETGRETATTLSAVRFFSPPGTEILVIDNASHDGSVERFRRLDPTIRVVRLPTNVGHALALDLGIHLAATELVVTLDSDAFPLGQGWLEPVTAPFADPSVVIAGSASRRGFAHPMYSCVRREAFVKRKLSWQAWRAHERDLEWGEGRFDAGELMTRRLRSEEVVLVPRSANRVDGLPGMTVADRVYHHGGVARAVAGMCEPMEGSWDRAVAALLPAEALPAGERAHT